MRGNTLVPVSLSPCLDLCVSVCVCLPLSLPHRVSLGSRAHRYRASVTQLLKSSLFAGIPAATSAALSHTAEHWGYWILALPPRERERLSEAFLAPLREFTRQFAAGWRGAPACLSCAGALQVRSSDSLVSFTCCCAETCCSL